MKKLKVGVLKETKNPPDRRVVLAPEEALLVTQMFSNIELFIQPSDIRCYTDKEYTDLGLTLKEDLSDCDILMGVKEVKIDKLISDKSYLFFSHTAKKQSYNRPLLNACLEKNIHLMDHEYLTDQNGFRLVAFGRWAGIVGAYNGLLAFGHKYNLFSLKRAKDCHDFEEILEEVKKIEIPAIKILLTGGGRVAHGALETLKPLNIKTVSAEDFLTKEFDEAVICQVEPDNYVRRKDGSEFDLNHFFHNPKMYESTFREYCKVADLYIPCHFWDQDSPVFFTKEDVKQDWFNISVIADVSCDINGPVPTTLRSSTIAEPYYGYVRETGIEGDPWGKENVTVMAVDNLPGELPRDASKDFGMKLIENVFPYMFGEDNLGVIKRASITRNGKLTEQFSHLEDFAKELE